MKIIAFCSIVLIATAGLYSCGPSVDSQPAPVTLIRQDSGVVTATGGTRLTSENLSCGCPFLMTVEGADTTAIRYEFNNFPDTVSIHYIRSSAKPGLTPGMHRGWLAIATVRPLTNEYLQDTLRDSVMIP